ncbi:hybrid sensor histidine kinase/response regulator [Photobacterium sanctipauli]|uniref:histidine kinase n=1 Tax=Photobacterium sanctipauli TaxID=1342794 RepID=A0A2T3NPV3_9GAMM|nr:hybrid sensor histidine kinase/response regulator [Photobacterium sanctipauli]
MVFSQFWNSLLIKHKLFLLVAMPLCLSLFLVNRQLSHINLQVTSLEKAQHAVKFLEDLSQYHFSNRLAIVENQSQPANSLASDIRNDVVQLFGTGEDAKNVNMLLDNYIANITEIKGAESGEELLELIEWQVDIYRQVILEVEKIHYAELLESVDNHLRALYQLEWLMFWSQEEGWFSQWLLSADSQDSSRSSTEVLNEIRLLAQNQQLFLNRFLAINADQEQVKLLLETFSDPVFQQSNNFRAQLLESDNIAKFTPEEMAAGTAALNARLSRLQSVGMQIEDQVRLEIEESIAVFTSQKNLFLAISLSLFLIVLLIGISLGMRITGNLKLVLKFLSVKDSDDSHITVNVNGKDELSTFAKEVKRLTVERLEQRQKLIEAKEEADTAKNAAIQASKAKSSFLANMSHEIRTPLNGVIGISEVLADTQLTATQKDYVNTIETSSHLLLSLINDILDFSKIESGMLHISAHSTAIRETIYDIASIVAPKVKEKGINLDVNIDQSVPNRVVIDDHRIRQVLMNFMSNAVKFTDKGTVSIGIKCQDDTDNVTQLLFEVSDSGIGIDEDRQASIFEPFTQEDESTTRQFGGTGLGLAISCQLIEMMGGKIGLDSTKGVGSRFYFTLSLPVDERDADKKAHSQDAEVILLGADVLKLSRITKELAFFGIDINTRLNDPALIPPATADGKQVVIISENNQTPLSDLLNTIEALKGEHRTLCLIRNMSSEATDFGDSIDALITYPLLGSRLIKAFQHCYQSVIEINQQTATSNIQVQVPHALLVEDNLVNQKVASLHLQKAGCTYDIANNGQEAVELFTSGNHYHFVLMDCMMPVMDGLQATEEIRAYEKAQQIEPTPILALTASVVDDDIQRCFDVGMDDYIPKPFKAEVLQEKILAIISTRTISKQPSVTSESNRTNSTVSKRVLLVEDNLVNQKVASLHLKKAGFEYDIANNGQEAIDIYSENQQFALILMDCMMPVKDGFEATKAIRSFESDNEISPVPIIALTASVVDDDIQRCFDAGMDAYVPKPVRREKLLHEMTNLIEA